MTFLPHESGRQRDDDDDDDDSVGLCKAHPRQSTTYTLASTERKGACVTQDTLLSTFLARQYVHPRNLLVYLSLCNRIAPRTIFRRWERLNLPDVWHRLPIPELICQSKPGYRRSTRETAPDRAGISLGDEENGIWIWNETWKTEFRFGRSPGGDCVEFFDFEKIIR